MSPSSLSRVLMKVIHSRFVIFISVFTCVYIAWQQYILTPYEQFDNQIEAEEVIENVGRDLRFTSVYRKRAYLPNNTKYILLWTRSDFYPFYAFGTGQKEFVNQNCSVTDCYVTTDRNFFGDDVTKFHAIAFNGRNLWTGDVKEHLPQLRAPHQKYVYVMTESAANNPVCDDYYDGFFNWTFTMRLDSDFPAPYFTIHNPAGTIIGPKIDMKWNEEHFYDIDSFDKNFTSVLKNRTKAAAWFVSNCGSTSEREILVKNISKELKIYNLDIDIYGSCGSYKCPRDKHSECLAMLERDYFFYMSLENSFARDYVTEKVLTAVQNNVVPVVWGGADYSRFLPPNSYIDGRNSTPAMIASQISRLMKSPREYKTFFRWKKYYSYRSNMHTNFYPICALCASLHDKKKFEKYTSYDHFRDWWNERKCK